MGHTVDAKSLVKRLMMLIFEMRTSLFSKNMTTYTYIDG